VYYERVDASPPGIAALRTDIAGFVGIAPMGPTDTPMPVQSFRQFQATFGAYTGSGFLAYAVNAFFANGGTRCWVVRVAHPSAAPASTSLSSPAPGPAPIWLVQASSPGVWGNGLQVTVQETHLAQTVSLVGGPVAPQWTAVASVNGFARATLVRISQTGSSTIAYKVVSQVDATNSVLYWVAADPDESLPYDSPLTGFSPNQPLLIESVEYTLLVLNLGQLQQSYQGLSLVPENPNYGPVLLPTLATLQATPTMVPTSSTPPEPVALIELRDPDELPIAGFLPIDVSGTFPAALAGGVDGLALLSVYDFIGEDVDPLDDDATRAGKQRGLRTLDLVNEVSILAVPDIQIRPIEPPAKAPRPPCVPDPCLPQPPPGPPPAPAPPAGELPPIFTDAQIYQVQAVMVARCEELRDRFALLDPPYSASQDDAAGAGAIRAWRARFDSQFAALHYPWLRVVDPLALAAGSALTTRNIPPCGHVAGQFANTDLTPGVYKAPANSPMAWVQDVTVTLNDPLHGVLNTEGINAIRALPGRGVRILGARTVSSDVDWRFLNVRRLMIMIEQAFLVSTQWAVFAPNDVHTRSKLRQAFTSYLLALWQGGALMGDTPAAAFYVTCDATNNPQSAIDQGQLLAEVGVAPSQPFEFVVVRVGRTNNEFQVTDLTSQ
jgi:hypothetical protein